MKSRLAAKQARMLAGKMPVQPMTVLMLQEMVQVALVLLAGAEV